ncbi:MAG TPA: protein kinase [Dongiaceae bacterium]|nr:protein kinase [Dongiaceae bacterium]
MDELLLRLKTALADRYTVEKEIGRGGMATVYLARDLRHDRSVAIKVLDPVLAERVGRDAFLNEMQVTARLQHPLILPLHDSGSADGLLYYVMPFVEGETLRDRLRREGQLPLEDAIRIARDVADALAYAHEKRIVHRDIKPENILLTGGHAVVADFGIARAVQIATDRTLLASEPVSGTPAYMSPEQATGEPGDARSDIYSLGCVLYEMLSGSPPFTAPTVSALMKRVLVEAPAPIRNLRGAVPEPIAQALSRSLEKLPADRWSTAAEFATALSRGHDTDTVPTVLVKPAPSQGFLLQLVLVALGFLIASGLLLLITRFLVQKLGLPDWVFSAALVLLAIGLPVLIATAFLQNRYGVAGARTWWTWRNAILAGGVAFLGLALLVSGYMFSRKTGIGPGASLVSAGVLDTRDRILITDFENATPDTLLGATLKEALSVDLAQSPSVTLVSSSQIAEALMRMQRDPKTPITPEVARELAIREGMKAILVGELRPLGKGYVLSARLLAPGTGDVLLAEREGADSPEELIGAVDRLSKKLRERIGESLKTIRANKALEQVTTSSLAALQKYSQGIAANALEGNDDKAIALLNEAVSLDTTFAMAYRKLATILANLDRDPAQARLTLLKAYRLRERLPDRERYLTEGSYYMYVNEWDKAGIACQKILDTNPEDAWALNNAGVVCDRLGESEKALEFFRRAYAASPTSFLLGNIINEEFNLGRYGDADKTLAELVQKFPDNPAVLQSAFLLTTGRWQYDLAENKAVQGLEMSKQSPFLHAQVLNGLGLIMAVRGRLRDAERYWQQAGAEFMDAGMLFGYLQILGNLAQESLFLRENPVEARTRVESFLAAHPVDKVPPDERPYLELTTFFAMVGDPAKARSLLTDYQTSVDPLIQKHQSADMHQALGAIAMAERRPEEALREFMVYRQKRADDPTTYLPLMGRAYETLDRPDSALAVYERYLNTPNVSRVLEDAFLLPGTLVRLGDLYHERGDRNRAVQYYSRFVDLWKDADPELQPRVRAVQMKLEALASQGHS